MKYNEAIDMILDGGVARKLRDASKIRFSDSILVNAKTGDPFVCYDFDITSTEWIVEKDGVVYEQKPNGTIPAYEGSNNPFDRMLEERREPARIDEDWLEKKIRCIIKKSSGEVWKPKEVLGTCCNEDCPFCFPEEKEEDGFSHKLYPYVACLLCSKTLNICKGHSASEWDSGKIEEPPEKVTVDNMLSLVFDYGYESTQFWHAWRAKDNRFMDLWDNRRQDNFKKIKQKLTYLVSLQEK